MEDMLPETRRPITLTRMLLGITALVAVIALFIFALPLWSSLTIAALLAYLLNPVVSRLEHRWRGKRPQIVAVVYVSTLLVILGILFLIGYILWELMPTLSVELGEALTSMVLWVERPMQILGYTVYPQALLEYLQRAAANTVSTVSVGSFGGGLLGGITENFLWALVILVSLYYFLRDGRKIKAGVLQLTPSRHRDEVRTLWNEVDKVWGIFLRVQLFIFFVLAVLVVMSTTLIIWLFRNGWLPLSPVGLIILLVVVYTAIQQVDNLWLRPRYMGEVLQLHPAVVIVSLLAALALTGVLGALLIVPLIATAKVLGFHFYHRYMEIYHPPAERKESVVS